VEGERAKASRTVRLGLRVDVTLGNYHRTFWVRGLSEQRGPASLAQALYEETPESVARCAAQRQLERDTRVIVGAKPDKQDRRRALRVKRGE
jgi:ribosome-associated heat shock protein Hsp15